MATSRKKRVNPYPHSQEPLHENDSTAALDGRASGIRLRARRPGRHREAEARACQRSPTMKPTGCGADCIDALQPVASLWDRLALRIAAEEGTAPLPAADKYEDPPWNEVAPGISCKLLASDFRNDRVSMLVRLLDGELWINERKLVAGDYHRAEAGTADRRVWSETGCTCVLITSTRDRLTL